MKNSRINALDNIYILLITLNVIAYVIAFLMRFISGDGYPFYIKLICAFGLTFVVLFAIIILVGFILHLFRKKRKNK